MDPLSSRSKPETFQNESLSEAVIYTAFVLRNRIKSKYEMTKGITSSESLAVKIYVKFFFISIFMMP